MASKICNYLDLEFCDLVTSLMLKYHVPGISVAVIDGDAQHVKVSCTGVVRPE